jgi:hypothetical protein
VLALPYSRSNSCTISNPYNSHCLSVPEYVSNAATREADDVPIWATASQVIVNVCVSAMLHFSQRRQCSYTIRKVGSGFIHPDGVSVAKQVLFSIYEHALVESPFITKLRDSSARSQQEAEIDDFIGICLIC